MTNVRACGVVYTGGLDEPVEALGVEVVANDGPAHVSAVGWEIESATGSAQIFSAPMSSYPQPRLPHAMAAGTSATWMISREEIVAAIADNAFGITIDFKSAVLRPFVNVNGNRVQAEESVSLTD